MSTTVQGGRTVVAVRVEQQDRARLEALAEARGTTKTVLLREAVRRYLESVGAAVA